MFFSTPQSSLIKIPSKGRHSIERAAMEQAACGVCRIAGVGTNSSSLGAGYRSSSPPAWLHALWEAILWTQSTSSGLLVLILSVQEIGHGSLSPQTQTRCETASTITFQGGRVSSQEHVTISYETYASADGGSFCFLPPKSPLHRDYSP